MNLLNDKQFTRMFRLNRVAFDHLLFIIEDNITPKGSLKNGDFHHFGKEITPRAKRDVALRWLAGGSYLDICFAFGISSTSFFRNDSVLWKTVAGIDDVGVCSGVYLPAT